MLEGLSGLSTYAVAAGVVVRTKVSLVVARSGWQIRDHF